MYKLVLVIEIGRIIRFAKCKAVACLLVHLFFLLGAKYALVPIQLLDVTNEKRPRNQRLSKDETTPTVFSRMFSSSFKERWLI